MPLSDVACQSMKPGPKPYRKTDGGGLSLLIQPSGSKLWQWSYRYEGRQKTLSIGAYPVIGLADARTKRDEGRRRLADGEDPKVPTGKAVVPNERSFETIARRWHDTMKARWVKSHAERVLSRLERDVFPVLGKRRIDEIEPPGPSSRRCGSQRRAVRSMSPSGCGSTSVWCSASQSQRAWPGAIPRRPQPCPGSRQSGRAHGEPARWRTAVLLRPPSGTTMEPSRNSRGGVAPV